MTQQGNISSAFTKKTEGNENVNIKKVAITRPKRYDIMIAYGGHGGPEMLKAAEFKKKRLQILYPTGVIPEPKIFKSRQEFLDIWKKTHEELGERNKSGLPKYDLHEIHIFAHSNPDHITIKEGEHIDSEIIKSLEKLDWNQEKGHLVLHSCRSGRHENDDKKIRNSKECIARTFSENQKTYVIGQMVYASFNYGPNPEDWKYRETLNDKIAIDIFGKQELVLWGYKSGDAVKNRYSKDKEYGVLSGGQIWPCRKYRDGQEIVRTVSSHAFNYDDLTFI
ncbi:hypothetical protein [Phytobacter sp. AG2a]